MKRGASVYACTPFLATYFEMILFVGCSSLPLPVRRLNFLHPFAAAQAEEAPHALDDLVDFQHGVNPEGRPMEHEARQHAQRDGSDP